MKKINLNELAEVIVAREEGKVSLPIGQVKEVLKITLEELHGYSPAQILFTIEEAAKKRKQE